MRPFSINEGNAVLRKKFKALKIIGVTLWLWMIQFEKFYSANLK